MSQRAAPILAWLIIVVACGAIGVVLAALIALVRTIGGI